MRALGRPDDCHIPLTEPGTIWHQLEWGGGATPITLKDL